MSTLIKADHVRFAFGSTARVGASGRPDEREAASVSAWENQTHTVTDTTLETAALRLPAIEQTLTELPQEAEVRERTAYERGLKEGIRTGQEQLERDQETQLNILRGGIESALETFRVQLDSLETLAIEVTNAALGKLFGETSQHADLVAQTARHHLNAVAAGSAIAVEVSRHDFPSDTQLDAAFAQLAGKLRAGVTASAQLPAGGCLIRLSLGTLDASLDAQSARIRAALSAICQQ